MAPSPSYLYSPPQSVQHAPHNSTSSSLTDSLQTPDSKRRTCRTTMNSSSSSNFSESSENRISKAKKGKRVHACEYPGCTKIFTRAEHRRRHELSHKSKKPCTCPYIGCHKSFHRADYLAQHMARHGGDLISPRKKHPSSIKTEPAAYSLSSPSVSRSCSMKSPIANHLPPIKSCVDETTQLGTMPCLQCLNCQNDQQCEREAIYPKDYSNALDQSCVSLVPSASALVATHIPNTPFSQAGLDSTIEIYMKNMLRPEAFTTSEQFTYPPAQLQEPTNASTWDANIDPNLPPLDPAILNHDNPYSAWPSSNVDIAHGVTTPQPEGVFTRDADS